MKSERKIITGQTRIARYHSTEKQVLSCFLKLCHQANRKTHQNCVYDRHPNVLASSLEIVIQLASLYPALIGDIFHQCLRQINAAPLRRLRPLDKLMPRGRYFLRNNLEAYRWHWSNAGSTSIYTPWLR